MKLSVVLNCMHKGFITMPIFIIAVLSTAIIVGGSGYGVYQYQMTAKENAVLRAQVENQNNKPSDQSPEQDQDDDNVVKDYAEDSTNESELEEDITPSEVIKEIVYLNQAPAVSPSDRQDEIDAAVSSVLNEQQESVSDNDKQTEPETTAPVINNGAITVSEIAQTSFSDGYGGVYGSYRLSIEVSPEGMDILIPPTTSDTLGSRIIGFTYSINGGDFKGTQDSKVDCGGLMSGGYCKIKDGTTKNLYAQVWIYPDSDSNGNYSVIFKKIRYLVDGVEKEVVINEESEVLNLYY